MNSNKITYLREALKQIPTEKLDEMLRNALNEEPVDEKMVRLILRVLEDREDSNSMNLSDGAESAWVKYLAHSQEPNCKSRKNKWLPKVATVALVIGLTIAVIPQQVQAENIWERLVRWTDSVFELFSPGTAEDNPQEYEFRTDHPGLQQVYDAVLELGVTVPVVPSWLPLEYELLELKVIEIFQTVRIIAEFSGGDSDLVFEAVVSSNAPSKMYYKDLTKVDIYEQNATIHNIMKNKEKWVVVWTVDNIECSIAIDCQEDMLYKILMSIYNTEDY